MKAKFEVLKARPVSAQNEILGNNGKEFFKSAEGTTCFFLIIKDNKDSAIEIMTLNEII